MNGSCGYLGRAPRRLWRSVILVLAVLAVTSSAQAASPTTSGTSTVKFAFGEGRLGPQFGSPHVRLFALRFANTSGGLFAINYPSGRAVRGRVTCLYTSGNQAFAVGVLTSVKDGGTVFRQGEYMVIGILDNGRASGGVPDLLNFSPSVAAAPACAPYPDAAPVFPLSSGDFFVQG
jgi:hypothetical protein